MPRATPAVQRRLTIAIVPFIVATLAGLVILWPSKSSVESQFEGTLQAEQFDATVTEATETSCGGIAQGETFVCFDIEARLDEGPDEGDSVQFVYGTGKNTRAPKIGDKIIVSPAPGEADAGPVEMGTTQQYFFVDFQRSKPLIILAALFALVVIALSRWRGVAALIGLVISLLILIQFMLPAILDGKSAIAVAIVGSATIMFPALYMAHGINARTTTAALGTLASLGLTGLLALLFVEATRFTGLSSEEATFLQVSANQINLEGLLLGGVIIGTLGVLDDVTITQASAVWELRIANPSYSARKLYESALRIGHDHIAATVNTLVLAYVGASLPLMIVFTISNRPLGSILTTEVIAEEIVRTLVGSIGLVASVPITTALAALALRGGDGSPTPKAKPPPPERPSKQARPVDAEYRRPKAEEEWRA